jgi:tetratricopeptide (TPR) repeat protein
MKKYILLIVLFCFGFSITASAQDDLDSLKHQLQVVPNDSLKSELFTRIAAHYLQYDAIFDKKLKRTYQNEAAGYTLSAIRSYSKYNDTTNLRMSFDNLAKVYHAQKKYSPAKWYILQSNALSRAKKDTDNIITSLLELAAIKSDIKDYKLAMRDLNEALRLSKKTKKPSQELLVQQGYALLYAEMKQPEKAAIALKRRDDIEEAIKNAQAVQLATLKADSVQSVKKKYFTASSKRISKSKVSKKIVSL